MTTQAEKDKKVAAAQKTLDKIETQQAALVTQLDQLALKRDHFTAHRDWLAAMPVDPAPAAADTPTPRVRKAPIPTAPASALTGVGTPPEGSGPLTNTDQ